MNNQIPQDQKNSSGVYLISHSKSDAVYVGATQLLFARYRSHASTLQAGTHINPRLQAVANEFGFDGLSFKVLEVWKSGSLSDLEEKWIAEYASGNLLNRTLSSGIKNPSFTKVCPIPLSTELIAKLDKVAATQRRSRSQLIRILIEDAVAAYEAENGPIPPPAPK